MFSLTPACGRDHLTKSHRAQMLVVVMMAALFFAPPAQTQNNTANARRLAFSGATVITATSDAPIESAIVLVEDGTITAVGRSGSINIPEGFEVIDVRGKWITPGLIDTNVHLILMIVPEFYVKYEDQLEEIVIQSAQVGLKYGMTTMADTWGPLDPLLSARNRINNGEFVGSRVLVAGNIIGLGGPFSAYFMGGWDNRGMSLRNGNWVHSDIKTRINAMWEAGMGPELMALTPAEIRAKTEAYVSRGVDIIKVGVSGHGISPVEPLMFSPRQLQAIRDVAREANLPFMTHSFTIESLRLSIDLDPDLLLHPNVMTPMWNRASPEQKAAIHELIEEIERKQILSGLMAIPERTQLEIYKEWDRTKNTDDPWLNDLMVHRQGMFQGVEFDEMAAPVQKWLAADIPYTLATDQGPDSEDLGDVVWGRLGRAHFDRMVGLQDVGEDPMDIIIAATANGAEALGLGQQLGTIEAGKIADMLVLDANPLDNIANMRSIVYVFKDGQIVDREALPSRKVLQYDPEAAWPR